MTDAVVAEVTAWQSRPVQPMYPVVFFDALRVKIRDEATVRNKAVYLALAVLSDGPATSWASGLNSPKAPNSGWRSSAI